MFGAISIVWSPNTSAKPSDSRGTYMPKLLTKELQHFLLPRIQASDGGLSMRELHSAFQAMASRRSLQRQLHQLVETGKLAVDGRGRSVRYVMAGVEPGTYPLAVDLDWSQRMVVADIRNASFYVPLSTQSETIRDYVRQPLEHRANVAYNREFLDAYVPNVTSYLGAERCALLRHLGTIPEGDVPPGTRTQRLMRRLIVDLSWASSRLEGNTYGLRDTQQLIEDGREAVGSAKDETTMILNHKGAIQFLIEHRDIIAYDLPTIREVHKRLSVGLLNDPRDIGSVRQRVVHIEGSAYTPPGDPTTLYTLLQQILQKANDIQDPFEQAFFFLVHLPYLQPFADVNKRVSRLGANIALIKNGLCPLSFIDVPDRAYIDGTLGVYELQRIDLLRDVFMWGYEHSCVRYLSIRNEQTVVDFDRARLRSKVEDAIRYVVRKNLSPTEEHVGDILRILVEPEDIDLAIKYTFEELRDVHEWLRLYRLTQADYDAWTNRTSS